VPCEANGVEIIKPQLLAAPTAKADDSANRIEIDGLEGIEVDTTPPSLEVSNAKKNSALREISKIVSEKAIIRAVAEAKQTIDVLFNRSEPRLFNDFRGELSGRTL